MYRNYSQKSEQQNGFRAGSCIIFCTKVIRQEPDIHKKYVTSHLTKTYDTFAIVKQWELLEKM